MSNPAPAPRVLRGAHAADITSVAFTSPHSLLTADADGVVVAWDARTHRPIGAPARAHSPAAGGVLSMRVVADGRACTHARDGTIKFWFLHPSSNASALGVEDVPSRARVDARSFCRLASDADGALVACAGGADGALVVLRARDGARACACAAPLEGDDEKVGMATCVAFVPSRAGAACCVAGYEDGSVVVWALDVVDGESAERNASSNSSSLAGSGRALWRARAHAEAVLCVSVDASGRGAMSGGADGAAVRFAFDVERLEARLSGGGGGVHDDDDDDDTGLVRIVRVHAPYANVVSAAMKQPGVSAVAIRADEKIVACGCWDGKIRVFEYKAASRGRLLAVLKHHEGVVTDVAFAPDGSVLASAARDGVACLWPIFPSSSASASASS